MAKTKKQRGQARIGAKIEHLDHEGKTHDAAVGQALGMARSGDLGEAAKAAAGPKPRKKIRLRKKHSGARGTKRPRRFHR